ncbi:Eco57I restriction-modification methylase domain-containing protein [Kineococcus terrestris]|uniref:Eco57I restriction-modification methylase domain-containing protein n=1 Tax=Kineococcus terrestris TaxID=2044856 RepID=UPI0034DAFB7A
MSERDVAQVANQANDQAVEQAARQAWVSHGEVYTRRWVVETLLDLSGYAVERDLAALHLLEPSAGGGAFLLPAVERLVRSAQLRGRDLSDLEGAVQAWELLPATVAELRGRLLTLLAGLDVPTALAQHLAAAWVRQGDFLLAELDDELYGKVDVVIGNPPYIRIEDLPVDVTAEYRRRWATMGGRADVYVGFIERCLGLLAPQGKIGFIVADRWMRNQYGAGLRSMISGGYALDAVWQAHDVDAFEQAVAAYPAFTVLRRGAQGPVVAAECYEGFSAEHAAELSAWTLKGDGEVFESPQVQAYRLPHWFPGSESWPSGTPARLRLIEHLNDNFRPLHDPEGGTKVSIGVATGADKTFITTDTHAAEAERMLPLAMAADIATGQFTWTGHHLLNPWDEQGDLVDLDAYPRLRARFEAAGSALTGRHVAKKAPGSWYRTIDKVHHELTAKPKLLLQDMKTTIRPVLEPGGYYPHHNLYYVTSDSWDMEVLGGLLLSRIAQAFIEAYSVRMRGGTLRFQSQYLKRIRVPRQGDIPPDVQERLRQAFRARDVQAATTASFEAYRVDEDVLSLD